MKSDTPRTDQQLEMATGMHYMANFACELERELAAMQKQRDEAVELYRELHRLMRKEGGGA